MTTGRFAAVVAALLGVIAASAHAARAVAVPLTGNWAGDHIAMTMTPYGARVTDDCADGSIDGAVVPDRHGRFRAAGTFAVHRPGPQLADEAAPAAAGSRFAGEVTGDSLVRTSTAPGGVPRKVTLVRNAHVKQVRCL